MHQVASFGHGLRRRGECRRRFLHRQVSPVSADSSSVRSQAAMSRASAAAIMPGARTRMSPGTTSLAATSSVCPARRTLAECLIGRDRRRMRRSVAFSVVKPIAMLMPITARVTTASNTPPVASESTADPASSAVGRFDACAATIAPALRPCGCGTRFAPAAARAATTCAGPSPEAATPRCARAASGARIESGPTKVSGKTSGEGGPGRPTMRRPFAARGGSGSGAGRSGSPRPSIAFERHRATVAASSGG